jgi:hypothetical protein
MNIDNGLDVNELQYYSLLPESLIKMPQIGAVRSYWPINCLNVVP